MSGHDLMILLSASAVCVVVGYVLILALSPETETWRRTKLLGYWNAGQDWGPDHISEILYKSPGRGFYLECFGGAQTEYAATPGTSLTIGHKIVFISRAKARKWYVRRNQDTNFVGFASSEDF